MTIHSAKGLEFDTVYIVGVEEGTFPSARSVDDLNGLEEERRLFYVAVTRAIKRLRISFALRRYKWGSMTDTLPSRFLREIDKKYIDEPELLNSGAKYIKDEDIVEKPARTLYKEERSVRGGGLKSVAPTRREVVQMPTVQPKAGLKPVPAKNVFREDLPAYKTDLVVGDKVEHNRFGYGVIESMEPFNGDVKATVNFQQHGAKTLLMKFAKLEKVVD